MYYFFNINNKQRKMKKNLTMLAIAAIVATGCTESEVIEQSSRMAIGFDTYIGKNTRGVPNMSTTFPIGSTMGVFTTKRGSANNGVMDNQLVTKITGTGWAYSPMKFYEINSTYTFSAYAPYSDNGIASEVALNNYVVSTDISKQVDLMYADEVMVAVDGTGNLSVGGATAENVKFTFHHALSQVKFSAKLKTAPEEGDVVKVASVSIASIKSTGTFTFVTSRWNVDETPKVNYTLAPTTPVVLNENAMSLLGDAGGDVMMLLPQSGTDVKVTLYLNITKGGKTSNQTVDATIASLKWDRNKIYHYQITVDNAAIQNFPIEFGDPIIEGWDPEVTTPIE